MLDMPVLSSEGYFGIAGEEPKGGLVVSEAHRDVDVLLDRPKNLDELHLANLADFISDLASWSSWPRSEGSAMKS